jgi:hypothetical protein
VQVILHGIDRENGAGDHIVMPGFGDNLTDAQIATLTNYVRNQYGNSGDNVDAVAVKTLRDNNVTVIPGYLLIAGGGVGALIVIGPFFSGSFSRLCFLTASHGYFPLITKHSSMLVKNETGFAGVRF